MPVRLVVEHGVRVPVRDGVDLATDVYRPDVAGPLPALLLRTPYNKDLPVPTNFAIDVLRAARSGYAVVVQDVRGRFASGGGFRPFLDEAADGADTIAWAAAQPWSSGKVGMVGASYYGATQWLAATQAPPELAAIAPLTTGDAYREGWTHQGGALQLGFLLHWALLYLGVGEFQARLRRGAGTPEAVAALIDAADRTGELCRRLPLARQPDLEEAAPYYVEWLAPPGADGSWRDVPSPAASYERITAPALNIGGWYDLFLAGTLRNYAGMRSRGGSPAARASQLVVGPWAHGMLGGDYAERSFGLRAGADAFDLTGAQLRWFDHHLAGRGEATAPVRLFVMGADEWREADDWPLPGTGYVDFHLHSGGRANTSAGDGSLSTGPAGDEPADAYRYDPRDPVPTVGGATFLPGLRVAANAGPRDQRGVEARRDVLCYTTAPLRAPVEVVGPVELIAYVSSSAPDTDVTAKLVDVWPDGRAFNVAEGILRARYRHRDGGEALLDPGRVEELRVDLVATANVFRAGHRIRLEVSSSNFPRFDRNPNTAGPPAEAGPDDLAVAVNRVHHDRGHPSRLVLPVPRRT